MSIPLSRAGDRRRGVGGWVFLAGLDSFMSEMEQLKKRISKMERQLRRLLADHESKIREGMKPAEITLRLVAESYGMKPEYLLQKSRQEWIAWPRQVCMWILRLEAGWSLQRVGDAFDRDHGTVMHAINRVEERCATEPTTRSRLNALMTDVSREMRANEPH